APSPTRRSSDLEADPAHAARDQRDLLRKLRSHASPTLPRPLSAASRGAAAWRHALRLVARPLAGLAARRFGAGAGGGMTRAWPVRTGSPPRVPTVSTTTRPLSAWISATVAVAVSSSPAYTGATHRSVCDM